MQFPFIADSCLWRALLAALVAATVALLLAPAFIGLLRKRAAVLPKCPSPDVARLQGAKLTTPSMGGLFVLSAIFVATGVCSDISQPYVWMSLATLLSLGALGFCDDLTKRLTGTRGLRARTKLAWQTAIALAVALWLYNLPLAEQSPTLGWLFVPLATLAIVGSSNAVNLTDGLDGLAGGCLLVALGAMAAVLTVVSNPIWAAQLHVPFVADGCEAIVVVAAMLGAIAGFLVFNRHPARVFLGDTGSLPLGGMLGLLAVIARQELLLVLVGGVFVAEAASVILQVACYRATRKRLFRCAPLHHHFQLLGWSERRIVARFWAASVVCGLCGLGSLVAMRQANHAASHVPQLANSQQLTSSSGEFPR